MRMFVFVWLWVFAMLCVCLSMKLMNALFTLFVKLNAKLHWSMGIDLNIISIRNGARMFHNNEIENNNRSIFIANSIKLIILVVPT